MRILVVDDDPQLRLLLVDTLQTIGYEALGAGDGVEALKVMAREKIDLVVSDISMPRIDGFQLASELRKKYPLVRILLITGVATADSERRALAEKLCDGYLAKPFRIDRIEKMIEKVLRNDKQPAVPKDAHSVLIVDDDVNFLDAMVETVKSLGYQASGESDCEAALTALRTNTISVVLADVSMPDMNGFDLLKVLKRHYPELPVVIMTGHNLSEPAAAMIRDSADDYLTKPFRQEEVSAVLSKFSA